MAPTLDAGGIVSSLSCPITETDTAFSLFCKVEDLCRDMIETWFPRLWQCSVVTTPAGTDYKFFRRKDMIGRQIDPSTSALQIYDYVRALTFPPFERPYVIDGQARHELTTSPHEAASLYRDAGNGRRVFIKVSTQAKGSKS